MKSVHVQDGRSAHRSLSFHCWSFKPIQHPRSSRWAPSHDDLHHQDALPGDPYLLELLEIIICSRIWVMGAEWPGWPIEPLKHECAGVDKRISGFPIPTAKRFCSQGLFLGSLCPSLLLWRMQEKGAPKSKCQARWFQRWEGEGRCCDQVPYILRYCWGVEVATFHHVLRSPWPWFHQVSAPSLQRFIRIWGCDTVQF